MNDYISREVAIEKITFLCELRAIQILNPKVCNNDDLFLIGLINALNAIKSNELIPSEDVQPVDRWISVKDRLPEIGKSVLIYYPKWDGDEIQVAKLEDDGMMFDICGEFNIGTGVITHWMPLPEPPKDGDMNG